MTTGVIFDCDGTLLDSMESWRIVEDSILVSGGVEPSDKITAELGPLTIPEAGAHLHEKYGIGTSGEDVKRMIDEGMLDYYRNEVEPREGALEFVRALHEAGVKCSVASSSPQPYLQAGLEYTGFTPYLEAIVSVDDVGRSKREPAVFDEARRLMGTALEDTWGFEDSLYAVHTLNNAGYKSVGIYDTDLAGTFEELQATADIAVRTFEALDVKTFL
ncbi:MAG: HAD family phosphatase [Raoultibacter sp.]